MKRGIRSCSRAQGSMQFMMTYLSNGRTGEFITIAYARQGSTLQHTIAGEVLVSVQ
ncbi:hypothetical protein GF345_03750 [Candidatus Woesearchaeota archaeon]|nr:hypothetical protein [Candidatus Woesearchaeota archaeon]